MQLRLAQGHTAFVMSALCAAGGLSRRVPMLGLAFAGILLSGCGSGARLYSAERDKQGQAAQVAWGKVDLKSPVEVPRQNLAKTLTEQLAIEDEIWAKRKERQASHMASTMTVAKFRGEAENGLRRVIGTSDAAKAKSYLEAQGKAEGALRDLEGPLKNIAASGVKPPPCSVAKTPADLAEYNKVKLAEFDDVVRAAQYVGAMKPYAEACAELETHMTAANAAAQGSLGAALKDLKSEEDALKHDKESVEDLRVFLKAAQERYAAAEKKLRQDPKEKQAVDKALDELRKVIAKLPSSANPDAADSKLKGNAIAQKVFSQERVKAINNFLATYDSVTKGEGAAAGSNRAAISLALFPDLQDKSKQALADAQRPNLTPLILTKRLEQVKYDAATKEVERRETLVELRRQHVSSLEQQSAAYLDAYQQSWMVPDGRLADVLAPYDEGKANAAEIAQKTAAWRGAIRFLEAEGDLRAQEGKSRYRIYALQNAGTLLYAESSILQWDALITPSVDLLAQYGAAGVTSKTAVDLVNSLILLGIAVRVN